LAIEAMVGMDASPVMRGCKLDPLPRRGLTGDGLTDP
jgi:hypothetical protein